MEVARDQLRSFIETAEVWMPVLGYEGIYEASNKGRIRRSFEANARSLGVPGKELRPVLSEKGYARVSLSKDGVVTNHAVHRLVLIAFCGPPPFEGAHAAHNDGDPSFNALTNLRWASPAENQQDVDRHGNRTRGSAIAGAKLTEKDIPSIRRRISAGESYPTIASDFGVSVSTISLIKKQRIWAHV